MSDIIRADLDELVFRSRNKEYGAYLLRKLMPRNTFQAFIYSAVAVLLILLIPILMDLFAAAVAVQEDVNTEIVLEEPPPLNEEEAPPPPEEVEPPPPPQREQVQYVPPQVVEAEEAPQDVQIVNLDTVRADLGTTNVQGDENAPPEVLDVADIGTGTQPQEVRAPPADPEDTFVMLDEQPTPVNMDAIKAAIQYPQIAKDNGIQGKVIMRVLIDEQGGYVKHKVLRSPHPWLTQEVERHINRLKFTPAIQGGRAIRTWVTVPFDFRIQ
jgi:protein TonB